MSYSESKPRYLYRVTDSWSYIKLDEFSKFDTHCTPWYLWSYRINPRELDRQRDWRHRFDTKDPNNIPMFISTTDDARWTKKEFLRRYKMSRKDLRLFRIDLSDYTELRLHLDASRWVQVYKHKTGTVLFSTPAASKAFPKWYDTKKQASEWFAVEWIPQVVIREITLEDLEEDISLEHRRQIGQRQLPGSDVAEDELVNSLISLGL